MSSLAPAALESAMRGTITAPGDPDYDDRRKLYNAMIDRRPRLIARCTDAADVIAAVGHARSEGMPLAIRGGGHNGAGLGSVDDGLVIDLSAMRGVIVDPASRVARVLGGSLLGDVDHACHPFGLALPSGIISTTGVGGITLGGGIGHLTRGGGLTIDNLIAADVVLADGRLVRTSETELPDLFWALRGGGGNFGVVVSFSFKLQEVGEVLAGPTLWPLEAAPAVMRAFDGLYPPGHQWYWRADFVSELPDEAIALHCEHAAKLPTMQSSMHMYPINGAAARVGKDDTAWAYRDAKYGSVIVGVDPDPAKAGALRDWTVAYHDALHAHS